MVELDIFFLDMKKKENQTMEIENLWKMNKNGGFTPDFLHVKLRVILRKCC